MKLSFDTIIKKKEKLDILIKKYPMISDEKTSWDNISQAGLCVVHNLYSSIYKEVPTENLPYLLGEKEISFKELKELMVKATIKFLKDAKSDERDEDELKELKTLKKLVNKITKKEFEKCFESEEKYLRLFPYLYGSEVNLNNKLFSEIYNYLVNNKIDVFKGLSDLYEYEDLLNKFKFDEQLTDNLLKIKKNTNSLSEDIVDLIKNNTSEVDVNLLMKQVHFKLHIMKINK
tara:strand:+ start:10952 stop:11647 length:696 start_codon:yes stop_codon:yes gene_type:complete